MKNTLFKSFEFKTLQFQFAIEIKTSNKSFEFEKGWNFYWIKSSNFKREKTKFWNDIKNDKFKQYGIYILFKLNKDQIEPIYVGETNNFTKREKLKKANNECQYILLINWIGYRYDNNRRIHENFFINEFKIQKLGNVQRKNNPVLKEEEIEELKEKFKELKILIEYFIELDLFFSQNSFIKKNQEVQINQKVQENNFIVKNNQQKLWKKTFYIKPRNESFYAKALISEDLKIEILQDSWFFKKNQKENISSFDKKIWEKNLRIIEKLEQQQIISLSGDKYIFKKNYCGFTSLNESASFFFNRSWNGKYYWKTSEKKSISNFLENEKSNLKINQTEKNDELLSKDLYQKIRNKKFYIKSTEQLFFAKGKISRDLKIEILQNSWFKKKRQNITISSHSERIQKKNLEIIEKLEQQQIISLSGDKYIFKKNYDGFNSLSQSSSFFFNRSSSGRNTWRTKEKKSINDLLNKDNII